MGCALARDASNLNQRILTKLPKAFSPSDLSDSQPLNKQHATFRTTAPISRSSSPNQANFGSIDS